MNQKITVETKIKAPIEKIWECWTETKHIEKWNAASSDWHTVRAINNLKLAGRFTYRMEAKDGSEGFDLAGTYTLIEPLKKIEYRLDDGRMVRIDFVEEDDGVAIIETFDPEDINSPEMQKMGWQGILNSFKVYTLSQNGKAKLLLTSIGAILAGFVTVFILSVLTDSLFEKLGIFPSTPDGILSPWMLTLALLYRCIYTVLGGYITAKLSPVKPLRNVVILGGVGTIAAILGLIGGWNLSAHWYPIALAITAFPLVWIGGWLVKSE